jgi:hypothetical protein
MIHEDEPELLGQILKRPRDRRTSHEIDRIQEPAEDHDRCTSATVVLEVHAAPVTIVRREWYRFISSSSCWS